MLLPGIWSASLPLQGPDASLHCLLGQTPVLKETLIHKTPPPDSGSNRDRQALSLYARLRPQSQTTIAHLLIDLPYHKTPPSSHLRLHPAQLVPDIQALHPDPNPSLASTLFLRNPPKFTRLRPQIDYLTFIYKILPQDLQSHSPDPCGWDSASQWFRILTWQSQDLRVVLDLEKSRTLS